MKGLSLAETACDSPFYLGHAGNAGGFSSLRKCMFFIRAARLPACAFAIGGSAVRMV